jgi:cell division protein FtsB
MNKLFYLLVSILLFLTLILLISIFSGDNSYSKKASLIKENKIQEIENNTLKNTNDILEFEIENAQKSKEHVENFARERLNLIYPNEEFISFQEEVKNDE